MTNQEILQSYGPAVELAATQAGVRPSLVLALIREATGGNPRYIEDEPSAGLCLVRPPVLAEYNAANGKRYQLRDLIPPVGTEAGNPSYDAAVLKSIAICAWYLARLIEGVFAGSYQLALQAYFEGVGRVKAASRLGKVRADAVFVREREFVKTGVHHG